MGKTQMASQVAEQQQAERQQQQLDQLCINTIRFLTIDSTQRANSGHPGMPMDAAPMAYVLWTRAMRYCPQKPHWTNRDRFVLSAGHGSLLLYSALHLAGYDLPLSELQSTRQWGSKATGHPEYGVADGVEMTTGPLGQGFASAVGMGMAEKYLAARFNRPGYDIFDYKIYAIVSDGDLMEGVSSEAASLAGHLGLNNLIFLYDDNQITIEGGTEIAFTEDSAKRFEAYGWFVQRINDGNDVEAITSAVQAAQRETRRPSIIMVRTKIGYGSPNKQGTSGVHGSPLGKDEAKLTKENLGWPLEPEFYIPDQALDPFRHAAQQGTKAEAEWQNLFSEYRKVYPELAAECDLILSGELPPGWTEKIPTFSPDEHTLATRYASGKILNAIAPALPMLLGGSADLSPSTQTHLKGEAAFSRTNYAGRNLHFGVREHAMGAIMNGLSLSGLLPYGSTFLIFSDYLRPSLRLAALMEIRSIYVLTHDSIFLGEDGPTHQPIEHLASLRAIPNVSVIRPADANETAVAWRVAIEHRGGPVVLCLNRLPLPIIDRAKYSSADGLAKGAYVLGDSSSRDPELILIATGSEMEPALEAYEMLANKGIAVRLVSMPSWDLFEKQAQANEMKCCRLTSRRDCPSKPAQHLDGSATLDLTATRLASIDLAHLLRPR